MTYWFLKSIGASDEVVANIESVHWAWARPEWLLLGLLLLGPAAWFVVVRHRRALGHVGGRPRAVLSACRIAVLLLMVLVMGGPYVKIVQSVERKPVLAVVLDDSASMTLPAGPFDDAAAAELARAAGLQDDDEVALATLDAYDRETLLRTVLEQRRGDLLPLLTERFDVRYYSVARSVRELSAFDEVGGLNTFERSETALGSVVERVYDDAAGRQIAGLVLLSDGRATVGPDAMQVVRQIGGDDDQPRVPIWAVPIGSDTPSPDVMVVDALAPPRVGRGDTVNVLTTIHAAGLADADVTVRLIEGDRVLDERTVRVTSEGRQQLQLVFQADEPGQRLLKVAIEPHDAERVTENNTRYVSVEVDEERLRLLYLEGAPRWDFRFLDHAFRRDGGIEARFVMEQQLRADGVSEADLPTAAGLPTDAEEFAEYDVVMLGDVSRAMLTDTVIAALVEAVEEEGVGLLVQAGTEHMPHAFADTSLAELLPLRFSAAASTAQRGGVEADAFAPFRMTVTATGAMHPAFALYGSAARNRELWNQMPAFYWAAATTEARPGATVVAELTTSAERRPLIASHFVGRGSVMFVGTDSTFRWRRNIGEHLFYSFWGQSLRHIARDEKRLGDRSWIDVQPRQVEPGSPVTVEVFALDAEGNPMTDATLPLHVQPSEGEGRTLELVASSEREGHYRAGWQAREPGTFDFVFEHRQASPLSARVRVTDSGREMLHPKVDRDALARLADISGGGMVELHALQQLPDRLRGEAVTHRRSHEQQVWDNWIVLVLLVGLYCTDVAIRRTMGLN